MKKTKVAKTDSDFARTPASSMAEKKPEKTEEDHEREGTYDLDHLIRADEIRRDENRMKYVHRAADKKHTAIRSIQDLKVAGEALAHKNRFPKREK